MNCPICQTYLQEFNSLFQCGSNLSDHRFIMREHMYDIYLYSHNIALISRDISRFCSLSKEKIIQYPEFYSTHYLMPDSFLLPFILKIIKIKAFL